MINIEKKVLKRLFMSIGDCLMTKIYFAYDGEVGKQETSHWHFNTYDKKYYPTNGIWEDCYYDYHAPLQTVFEKNNIKTKSLTIKQALIDNEKFVYVLTFRYLRHTILRDNQYNFFLHLPIGLIQTVNSGKCTLVLNDAHESAYYTEDFFNQLMINLKRARLDSAKIIIVTGNPSNNLLISPIKLVFWQYFETAVRLATENLEISYDSRFAESNKPKKFLCLNRIPRETRYFFMYEMYKRNLLDNFNASLDKVNSIDEIKSFNDNAFFKVIKDKDDFNKMLSTLPWIVDVKDFKLNHWDTIDKNFAHHNLIFITTETLFKGDMHNLFLTEKTFKPISLKMPFIIIGQPGTLDRLRLLGYKTFSSIWDESYDGVLDPIDRMLKICDLVEQLSKLSTEDLKEKINNAKDILDFNYNLLKTRRPELEIIETVRERL